MEQSLMIMSPDAVDHARNAAGALLTVCIPTYKRPDLLARCLSALGAADEGGAAVEFLVVINGPADAYLDVLPLRHDDPYGSALNPRVVHEAQLGSSRARNAALAHVHSEWVAYLDDDTEAHRGWIREAVSAIKDFPQAHAFGGPYVPLSSGQLPDWAPPGYGGYDEGTEVRPIVAAHGNNMIIRRDLLVELGGFREDLGIQGDRRGWTEDTDFFIRAGELGAQVLYVPGLMVGHHISDRRLTFRGAVAFAYAYGRSLSASSRRRVALRLFRSLSHALRAIVGKRGDHRVQQAASSLLHAVKESGKLVSTFRGPRHPSPS
jgi:glucosyl-dolichyl phosphate glucuronosyltransferase